MYQEDLKLENYAISVAHPPPGDRSKLCPVPDVFIASSVSSSNAFFLFKIFCKQTRKEPCNPIYVWAAGWATLPWKQLELILSGLSALPSWHHVNIMFVKTSPFSDDMGAKELVTIFLSARLSSSSQFCSTNVLADDSEVWPWLWHVTCTLETIFSTLKKKKKKKCDSLYTVTCQDNNHLRRQFGAGFPLLLQPPLQPARQGEFQWTLSLGCTES